MPTDQMVVTALLMNAHIADSSVLQLESHSNTAQI